MKIVLLSLSLFGGVEGRIFAQNTIPTSTEVVVLDPGSVVLPFCADADISESAVPESPFKWGMDVAWDSRSNVHRGTNFIGTDVLSVGRVSFQPSDLVDENGNLSATQKTALQSRLDHIALSGVHTIILNCDHEVLCNHDNYPNCDQNYANYHGKPEEWHRVIKATVEYCRAKGFTVVTISPFNEPDYTAWKEGTKEDFKEIARLITEDPDLAGIRVSAGNTLNCDQALPWYEAVKPYASEGNTHQLAGSFDNYASFWQTVRADGNFASADELHNTMEAFVGIHYGLQAGVWWGFDGAARGEFCKSSYYGKEIGYAENRNAWTAAAVYKRNDGRVDAFLGGSERQAKNSSYSLLSCDRDVYFDGEGPRRVYKVDIPGGTGYQNGQTNAERMVQVQYGEDVPVEALVAGQEYVIMNRNSQMGIGYYNGARGNDIQICQNTYTGKNSATHMRWIYEPVSPRIGGDFGYFVLRSARDNTQVIDLLNWSEDAGGTLIAYAGGLGANEQWFTEYAGDGYYYIRSRHSGLYLEVKDSRTNKNAAIQQAVFTGADNQRWRFMPTSSALEVNAPSAPIGLTAEAYSASVHLAWDANPENDVVGYQVMRGQADDSEDIQWDVIGRMVEGTEFVDNGCVSRHNYIYKVCAVDESRNISVASDPVSVIPGVDTSIITHYTFEQNSLDQTTNRLDAYVNDASYNSILKKEGGSSLYFNGASSYVQLPHSLGSMECMTIATWAYCGNLSSAWTRIFDFGNGTDQYMFLTPNNGSEMRFVIKDRGAEQILGAPKLATGWHHVAVSISDEAITLYVDGSLVAQSADISLRPSDIHTVLNYVGRSQFQADPLFKGYIDDFRIYNYALSADDIAALASGQSSDVIAVLQENAPCETEIYSLSGVRQSVQSAGLQIVVEHNADGTMHAVKRINR